MTIVNIQFKGIDSFNRPIFKDVNSKTYYGCTSKLFGGSDSAESIIEYFKKNIGELEYFGNHFDCEPNGGLNPNIKLNIV